MSEDNFQILLDGVDTGKTSVMDVCKNYNDQDSPPIITGEQFSEHPFFTKYFSKQFCEILEKWFSDGTLDENQKEIFKVCAEFVLKLTKTSSHTKPWLNQQTELIDLSEKCLNEIASYGYYIEIGDSEDPSLESFDLLLRALENVQCQQLLGTLAKCVTSRYYIDALDGLNDVHAFSLTISQHFLLVTCPNYIITCDTSKTYCLNVVTSMLGHYNEAFTAFLPRISQWTIPVILSLIYPMKFILISIRSLPFEHKQLIYEIILTIIIKKSEIDPNLEQGRITLIYTSLSILIQIIRSDKNLANKLKNKTDRKADLLEVLYDLSKTETNNKIKLKALELLSLLVPEEVFLKEKSTEEVTGLFVKNFNDAFEEGATEQMDEVLTGLKDLVQSDEVRQEIVKQNGLPSIIKYAKKVKNDPLPLEITYAMTFNTDAKTLINEDTEFVDHIKELRQSERKDVSKIAHGIMWKLEGEEKFKKKEKVEKVKEKTGGDESKEKEKTEGTESKEDGDKQSNQYDMMISYCWAQQALCHKINDRLEKDGYNVWLDRDEMHGSIIESMAAAIEQSKFVLICMSSNYKNSINCKAEAEYAFSQKSKIVPLIVEPSYKADGWLGFLAGSKIYVDFADKEDDEEEFEKAYELLIGELKRNGLGQADPDKPTAKAPEPVIEPEKPEKEPEPPRSATREYLNVGPVSMWTSEHVTEFLIDNQLDQLLNICESMDGETLTEFFNACQSIPDKMYGLVNNTKEQHPVSINTFYRFISRLKKLLPLPAPRKVHFQYNFIYPESSTTTAEATKDKQITE